MPPPPHTPAITTRKRRSNSERVRVTRACDRCKRRKIKCNNSQPCQFCIRAKTRCTFDSSYARGRKFLIPSAHDDDGDTRSPSHPASGYSAILPSPATTQNSQHHVQAQVDNYNGDNDTNPLQTSTTTTTTSSRLSPEPSQTDLQGHYIGPASGVSFLLRVQKRLHQAISFSQPGSIFTFGDAPLNHLPDFDPSFCMMLPRADAQKLIDRYFDFAMPTYRFLHRPTVQEWFGEFYDTLGVMRDKGSAPAKVALLFMVFSLARVYMPDDERPGPMDLSARYYLAAEHQLTKEKGSIRLTSVQARLTQCYYLLTQSRINHCWSLFGTVSHLALAIGLNRNRRPDPGSGISPVEAECRRRTFWCAYTLDAYLSAALGRPRSFHDEDVDTELPACVEDHELLTPPFTNQTPARSINSHPNKSLTTMLAPIAHMKIARIISRILRDLYSIRPLSETRRLSAAHSITRALVAWRADLAWFLDADVLSASLIMPIFQRQRNVLNLTYWHSIILTHRPFMLSDFGRLTTRRGEGSSSSSTSRQTEESVKQCLHAAMKTVEIIDQITHNRQLFRAFWTASYIAFNATIILYIYVIQNRAHLHDSRNNDYFAAATRCQSHLSAIAEKGSLSERYVLVLEELRVEATRQTSSSPASFQAGGIAHAQLNDDGTIQRRGEGQGHRDLSDSNGGAGVNDTGTFGLLPGHNNDASPQTMTTNYTADSMGDQGVDLDVGVDANGMGGIGLSGIDCPGWGQFTSMVSSGLGNMDFFWGDEALRF